MQQPILHIHAGQHFWLSPARTVFWEEEKVLIISDLHFGKTGHFRKAGIPIPQDIFKEDLQRLLQQVQDFNPAQLIVVGDMFHSKANKELELFQRWRNDFPLLKVHLVKGNHDILASAWYQQSAIEVHNEIFRLKNIAFVHDCDHIKPGSIDDYYFCGHLHPGISISGVARQSLKFPCFHFCRKFAVLPAFSRFTGLAMIRPCDDDFVFAIVENKIIPVYGKQTI